MNALKRQAETGLEVGVKEEKSAFLTYLLSQTDLSLTEIISNCIDLMLAAVDTVLRSVCCYPVFLLTASTYFATITSMSVLLILSGRNILWPLRVLPSGESR